MSAETTAGVYIPYWSDYWPDIAFDKAFDDTLKIHKAGLKLLGGD